MMLSLRQFAEKFIPGVESIQISKLASSLRVPSPISLRYMLEGKR